MDQPWLSRQVQQLEAQLGFLLLERTTQRIELTAAGREFLKSAQALAEAARQAREAARNLAQLRRYELRLGISRSIYWMPARQAVLDTLEARYPNISLTTVSNLSPKILAGLAARKIDGGLIAIAPTSTASTTCQSIVARQR